MKYMYLLFRKFIASAKLIEYIYYAFELANSFLTFRVFKDLTISSFRYKIKS